MKAMYKSELAAKGGLDEQGKPCNTLNSLQFERIKELLVVLKRLFPKAEIVGHRDLPGTSPKECPCFEAKEVFCI